MERRLQISSEGFKDLKEIMKDYKFMIKPFLILMSIYTIGIITILRANINYIDDIGRVVFGYKQWGEASRYLSYFLSSYIHGDSYLTDVSPLPQLLALLLVALSGVIVLYVVSDKKNFSIWGLISLVPLGLSPYFLECISYKYDSPYMALSIFASVFPMLFIKRGYFTYFISSLLGILVVCTTYQASLGIFPMLVLLLCMKRWNNKDNIKDIIKFAALSTIGYGVVLLLYYRFLMLPMDSHVSNSMPASGEILSVMLTNLIKYFTFVISDFKIEWLILLFLMMIAFIYFMVRDSKQKKYFALPLSILSMIVMAIMSFGIYPIFSKPLFEPRAMFGFGVFISFIGVFLSVKEKVYPVKLVCLALSWAFFTFSFTYGNALAVQNSYTNFRISILIEDLNDLEVFTSDDIKTVQLSGTIGFSPIIRNMPQDYQMLNRLIPITLQGEWFWGKFSFYTYYDLKKTLWDDSIDLSTYNLPVLKDTMYHTIKGNDHYVLIEFR